MKHKLSVPCFGGDLADGSGTEQHACRAKSEHAAEKPLPLWRASARMALVTIAGIAAVCVMATGMVGCADMSGIASKAVLRDTPSFGLETATSPSAAVSANWWEDFGDEQLNTLVTQALQDNLSLKIAQARLARAQAVTDVANAATLPQLSAQLDATRQRYSANGLVPPPIAGSVRNIGTAQLIASWELDFFGKNRAAIDAAVGSLHAAEADAQAARVLLASNVARGYFQLVRLNGQVGIARRTLGARQETLKLVQDRVSAGLDTRLELRQSEGGLPEARLQLESLQEQMALTRNALAALIGQSSVSASAIAANPISQAAIKKIAVTSVIPADLLGRRADITAARWRVEASIEDVANAKAEFYPNINLVAFVGFSSIGLNRLFDSGSQQWGVGPAVRLPIFEAGRLRANLRGKAADQDAAIESYNAAVLDAVRDVADQLASVQSAARQQTEQRAASDAAEGAYDIAVQRFRAGLGTYLNVLTAETNVLAQRRAAVDLVARVLDTQVALIRALGGGYKSAVDLPPVASKNIDVGAVE